jgi:hypothetical protein
MEGYPARGAQRGPEAAARSAEGKEGRKGKIIFDKQGEDVILLKTIKSNRQRSPKAIWGFCIFRDKDALFKVRIALERVYFFKGERV